MINFFVKHYFDTGSNQVITSSPPILYKKIKGKFHQQSLNFEVTDKIVTLISI